MTPTRGTLLAAGLLALAACSGRPEAPPLEGEAVYQNEAAGLRFLAPAGWVVRSRAVLPAGPLPRVFVVVSYQSVGGERPAALDVLAADVPADADPARFLADRRLADEEWTPQSAGPATINGVPAVQFLMTRTQGKEDFRREVTAFRQGDRVYFFLITFAAPDGASRDTGRGSVASVTWTK